MFKTVIQCHCCQHSEEVLPNGKRFSIPNGWATLSMTARISGRPVAVSSGKRWSKPNRGFVDATQEEIKESVEYNRRREALQKACNAIVVCPHCVRDIADGLRKL